MHWHWIKTGLLKGEEGELWGQRTYWVSLRAKYDFTQNYMPVSDLAKLLETTSKALKDRVDKLGVRTVGELQVSPTVSRGGVIALRDVLCSQLIQPQGQLFIQGDGHD